MNVNRTCMDSIAGVYAVFVAATLALAAPAAAQMPDSLVGRDVRVWRVDAERPVSGVVTHATSAFLRLSTAARVCSEGECRNSFSAPWTEIARIQLNSHTQGERIARVALVAGGSAAFLGVGLASCQRRATLSDVETCRKTVFGLTLVSGATAFYFSRPSWNDVPVPYRDPDDRT